MFLLGILHSKFVNLSMLVIKSNKKNGNYCKKILCFVQFWWKKKTLYMWENHEDPRITFFVIEYLQISQLSNHLLCNCEMRENLCEKDNFGP